MPGNNTGYTRLTPALGIVGAALSAVLGAGEPGVEALAILRERGVRGAVVVLEAKTGEVIASGGVGRDVSAPVLPLSVVKVYLAAIWWDHGFGDGSFERAEGGRVTVSEVLVYGLDRPAEEMAVVLRRRIGAGRMLGELTRYGLGEPPGQLTLPPSADDETWGKTLSIGEQHIRVTLSQVSRFLRAIALGGGGLVKPETARRLQAAMLETVARGTARSAAPRLAGSSRKLGGKTGTGPFGTPVPDGWFAGLIFEDEKPRYTVAVYIDARGPGGGAAASIAADIARLVP